MDREERKKMERRADEALETAFEKIREDAKEEVKKMVEKIETTAKALAEKAEYIAGLGSIPSFRLRSEALKNYRKLKADFEKEKKEIQVAVGRLNNRDFGDMVGEYFARIERYISSLEEKL